MDTQVNLQLPALGKDLLNKVRTKQITMEDFNKECAYWMTGDISTMYFKSEPDKPGIVANYQEERNRDPKYEVAPSFWNRPDVKDYTVRASRVRSENRANWHWLMFMKHYIPKADTINQGKIARAMASYPKYEDGYIPKDDWRNR